MAIDGMTLYGISEDRPGPRWKALFDEVGPAYLRFYLSEGQSARPTLATARERLERHMPELVDTWESLVALAGGDDLTATMLTWWDPPKFLPGCSQAVLTHDAPTLVRNYDYTPDLFERVMYSSAFRGRRVLGTGDCLWGLLDGMNDSGLVVSLAFGGRPGSGRGFGAPMVLRYVLEVADDIADAKRVLARVPVSMAYNFTMVDASGEFTTAFISPDNPPEFAALPVATNHRGSSPENPEHARRFASLERQRRLHQIVSAAPSPDEVADALLTRPLFNDQYDRAFGTLYTAIYRPDAGTVEYRWHADSWVRTFDSPEEVKIVTGNSPRPGQRDDAAADNAAANAAVDNVAIDNAADPDGVATAGGDVAEGESSIEQLVNRVRDAVTELARQPDPAAFQALLSLYESLGAAVGHSARTLAAHGSWSWVGDAAGVSRQAAWYRWREEAPEEK